MSLSTYLYFLLRLKMSAFVTVLPLYVFMVYTAPTLPFTPVLEELLQNLYGHNSVSQKLRAVWSHGTVCHLTVLCWVKTRNGVIWSVLNMEAWKPMCMWLFLLCDGHLSGFGVLVVSMLASGTQVRGFAPSRSHWIFQVKKSSAYLPSEGK
jgi:hypothetical protein